MQRYGVNTTNWWLDHSIVRMYIKGYVVLFVYLLWKYIPFRSVAIISFLQYL
jgi:hypothetical protein